MIGCVGKNLYYFSASCCAPTPCFTTQYINLPLLAASTLITINHESIHTAVIAICACLNTVTFSGFHGFILTHFMDL